MKRQIISSFLSLFWLTLLLGVIYPLGVSAITQTAFPYQTEGSLIKDSDGKVIGSELIGQNFTSDKYFWGRLSATSPAYNPAASSGSNLGVNNPALMENIKTRLATPPQNQGIPIDLITASGSGLDPHISPEAAFLQAERVAKARGLTVTQIKNMIQKSIEKPDFGIFGAERVNVLKLNLKLDKV